MSPRTAQVMLQLTVFVWGFTAILGKQITVNAMSLVFYRMVITVVALGAWTLLRKRSLRVAPKDALKLAGIGALITFHWVCFYGCIKEAGVAVAVLCLASVALFTALIEPLVYRRRVRAAEIAIGLGVLAGVYVLIELETAASGWAIAAGLMAAVGSSTFGTLNGRLRQRMASEAMAVWELATGALWLGLVFLLVAPDALVPPSEVSAADWLWLAVMAVVCTALPWITSLDVVAVLTPYTVALGVTLEPVYSMVIAYFWFPESERLSGSFYAGALMLIVLVMVDARLRSKPVTAPLAQGG